MYFEFRILIVSYDVPLHYIRIYLFYGNNVSVMLVTVDLAIEKKVYVF